MYDALQAVWSNANKSDFATATAKRRSKVCVCVCACGSTACVFVASIGERERESCYSVIFGSSAQDLIVYPKLFTP